MKENGKYKSLCGLVFERKGQIGGHSTNCSECKSIKNQQQQSICIVCGKKSKNNKFCSNICRLSP